jgi:hypothetical protein
LHDPVGMKDKNPRSGGRPDDGDAFVPDPISARRGVLPAPDAESLAEEFIASATMGQSVGEDARDEFTEDEVGGPFVEIESEREREEEEEEALVTPRVLVPRVRSRPGA